MAGLSPSVCRLVWPYAQRVEVGDVEFDAMLGALRAHVPADPAERAAFAREVADQLERLRVSITDSGMTVSREMLARIDGAIVALRLLTD